jgi:hypothetical protein
MAATASVTPAAEMDIPKRCGRLCGPRWRAEFDPIEGVLLREEIANLAVAAE